MFFDAAFMADARTISDQLGGSPDAASRARGQVLLHDQLHLGESGHFRMIVAGPPCNTAERVHSRLVYHFWPGLYAQRAISP